VKWGQNADYAFIEKRYTENDFSRIEKRYTENDFSRIEKKDKKE